LSSPQPIRSGHFQFAQQKLHRPMIKPSDTSIGEVPLKAFEPKGNAPLLPRAFVLSAVAIVLCFGLPLYRWARFALQSDLYSYTLLVPAVSIYLFYSGLKRPRIGSGSSRGLGLTLLCLGGIAIGTYLMAALTGLELAPQDSVALSTSSFVLLIAGMCALFFDQSSLRRAAFPLAFLFFMIPFPVAMEHAIESFLQRGSAPPAFWFLKLAGTPVFREDMIFQLPGITLHIAPECSGIRSSIVLFMTSLVAGHLFLRSPWKRAILSLAVIPLALLRNGFRVFVIGQLCVSVGPHMIDSALHRYGGTIFFLLSLIPFSLLTYYLLKSDRSQSRSKAQPFPS
jgi:exosortase C (VPDSG-CTERM-specific)